MAQTLFDKNLFALFREVSVKSFFDLCQTTIEELLRYPGKLLFASCDMKDPLFMCNPAAGRKQGRRGRAFDFIKGAHDASIRHRSVIIGVHCIAAEGV
jgi:hypothetical protein